MTLPLKTESIEALYEYLRSLPPFSTIKLMPHADDVEFWVGTETSCYAWWKHTGKHHRISISSRGVGQTITLIEALGHEMCHMAVHELGQSTGGNENTHNTEFRRLARRFCKVHGLDAKAFF